MENPLSERKALNKIHLSSVISVTLLFFLLMLQISNSVYYCASSKLSDCLKYAVFSEKTCPSPGSIFDTTSPQKDLFLHIFCPWEFERSIKVLALVVCIFNIMMFQLYKKARGTFRHTKVGSTLITILSMLLVISGTVDFIYLLQGKCVSSVFEDYKCNRNWFFVNVLAQILAGIWSSYTVIKGNLMKPRMSPVDDRASLLTQSGKNSNNNL